MIKHTLRAMALIAVAMLFSCREDEIIVPSEAEVIVSQKPDADANPMGMYIVNEGNMGSNKCTLDYVDFVNGFYVRNIYSERNPNVVKELGDVGNDIQIYGNKMYVVVNCSHKVEVLDARTARRITQIDIPNCRYIKFHEGKAYVTSYVAPVQIDPDAPRGAVYRVDTTSLKIEGRVVVGYQPDELEILDDKIYVANSGGYRAPDYDNTVSVVDIPTFRQVRKIPVGINLAHIRSDKYGRLWVTSRGDFKEVHSNLYVMQKRDGRHEMQVTDTLNVPCSNFCISGDSLYFFSTEWSINTQSNAVSYGIIDIRTKKVVTSHFITDGTEGDIKVPYGLTVHPVTKDIYITDAKNYVSSGTLYCYDRYGKRRWGMRTGDIPAHMTFLYREKSNKE